MLTKMKIHAFLACVFSVVGEDLIGTALPEPIKKTLLKSVSQYFVYTMHCLLQCFSKDRSLLEEKGFFIIR